MTGGSPEEPGSPDALSDKILAEKLGSLGDEQSVRGSDDDAPLKDAKSSGESNGCQVKPVAATSDTRVTDAKSTGASSSLQFVDGGEDDAEDEEFSFVEKTPLPQPPRKDKQKVKKPARPKPEGASKPTKKNNRQCRACLLWFPDEGMALGGFALDITCKYKVDCIYRIAKSQKRMDWYQAMRQNDVQLQECVAEYKRRTSTAGRAPSRCATLQALEEVVATTATIVDSIGEMMFERLYISFAESLEGGKLTETQAKQQWLTWKTLAEEPDSKWPPHDHKGPNNELRIWVKTKDVIKYRNMMEQRKVMQAKEKELKNASEEDVRKMHKQLQINHGTFQGMDSIPDMSSSSVLMQAAVGGECFNDRQMDLPDVSVLAANSAKNDEDEAADNDDEEEEEETQPDAQPETRGSKRKGPWFSYDKVVGKAKRAERLGMDRLTVTVNEAIREADDAWAALLKVDRKIHAECTCEERSLQKAMEAVKAVASGDQSKLDAILAKYAQPACDKTVSSQVALANAPPCPSHAKLILVANIADKISELEACFVFVCPVEVRSRSGRGPVEVRSRSGRGPVEVCFITCVLSFAFEHVNI